MSDNQNKTPAEILIRSAVHTVGKREFIKTVASLFGTKKDTASKVGGATTAAVTRKPRTKHEVPFELQCVARVKGARTGIKIGRFVLFESARCDRKEVDGSSHLCAIHTNQVKKTGALPFGKAADALTEEQQKTFV